MRYSQNITQEPRKWVPLPRNPNVVQIIDEFLQVKRDGQGAARAKPKTAGGHADGGSTTALDAEDAAADGDANAGRAGGDDGADSGEARAGEALSDRLERWQQLLDALRTYFDKALPLMLLYRHEREQYERLVASRCDASGAEFSPATAYGAEHLLRLFTKLPAILGASSNISPPQANQLQIKLGDFLKFLQKNQERFFLPHYELVETLRTADDLAAGRTPDAADVRASADDTLAPVAAEVGMDGGGDDDDDNDDDDSDDEDGDNEEEEEDDDEEEEEEEEDGSTSQSAGVHD